MLLLICLYLLNIEYIYSCREKVFVPNCKPYISLIGDKNRISDTIITWNSKASDKDNHGPELGTYRSASVAIESDYFCATGITFEVIINRNQYVMTCFLSLGCCLFSFK